MWPIRINKGPLLGHTHRSSVQDRPSVPTPVFFLPVLMLPKEGVSFKNLTLALKTDELLILSLNKLFRRSCTLEANSKLKIEAKSWSTKDFYLSLFIYFDLGEMCFPTLVSFHASSSSKVMNIGF